MENLTNSENNIQNINESDTSDIIILNNNILSLNSNFIKDISDINNISDKIDLEHYYNPIVNPIINSLINIDNLTSFTIKNNSEIENLKKK